jgi:hypothetical protein
LDKLPCRFSYLCWNLTKEENDLGRRDALLEELRALAQAFPQDSAVHDLLAMGLFTTRNAAKKENDLVRRDALLVELRQLQQAWPQNAAVREPLAMGLFNTSPGALTYKITRICPVP